MTIFVINIGDTVYGKYSLAFIEKLCEHNNINLFVLSEDIPKNIYNLHPSWLKLFSHSLIDDDFILCWDLDLVPTKLYNIKELIDYNNLNFCYDGSYLNEGFTFNGKFKYNCGLIGVPKKYQQFMENIYHEYGKYAQYPSYEQYYVNDEVFNKNITPNVLNNNLNYMFNGSEDFSDNIYNIHYTWKINSNQHRIDLIKKHINIYGKNF
jgi:hypothetical protein